MPHCDEEIRDTELNYLEVPDGRAMVLVCPECDTMLGSLVGDSRAAELTAVSLARDIDELIEFADAWFQIDRGEDPDPEVMKRIEERMGGDERTD